MQSTELQYLAYVLPTLVDLQLDVQNSYLFTYNTFIKILYIFQAHIRVYVVIVYMQPVVSSLCKD